jgi:hypothetical protein
MNNATAAAILAQVVRVATPDNRPPTRLHADRLGIISHLELDGRCYGLFSIRLALKQQVAMHEIAEALGLDDEDRRPETVVQAVQALVAQRRAA